MASPADTVTPLNPAAGGDKMGESLAYQQPSYSADLLTPPGDPIPVKHPRVVAVDDTGRILDPPLTEATGRKIVALLASIDARLATAFRQL